jgi:hypothetical protein
MQGLSDEDLSAAGRVFAALIAAMRRYQDELSAWKPPERSTD